MTDAETRQAAAAVAAILHRAFTDGDPDVIANEIIQALRARGWRHPIPRPPVTMAGPPVDEDRMHAIAAQIRERFALAKDNPVQLLDSEEPHA